MIQCFSLLDFQKATTPSKCIIALGNFDGVHIAHKKLLCDTVSIAKEKNASSCLFCFYEDSSDKFSKELDFHLSSLQEKWGLAKEQGIQYAFVCHFEDICNLSALEFINLLKEQCNAITYVCGFNYRFGKNAVGDTEYLKSHAHCDVFVEEPLQLDGITISSTEIRNALKEGNIEKANRLLGYSYFLSSPIIHGKGLGHTWGFPTANQDFPNEKQRPKNGVYLTKCTIDEKTYYGVSNVGVHPSIDNVAKPNCETFLFHCSCDLYGKTMKTEFLTFIRPEMHFEDENALQKQIRKDLEKAENKIMHS